MEHNAKETALKKREAYDQDKKKFGKHMQESGEFVPVVALSRSLSGERLTLSDIQNRIAS